MVMAPGVVRRVYFDVATGRLAGRTSENEATVVFADWREVAGVELPFERTDFPPDSGEEWRWQWDEITLDEKALDREAFVMPEALRDAPK